jgi:hypothetical protein
MTQLITFQDMQGMAQAIAKSGLFGMKTPEQALALMLIAQAEGKHPGIVARDYHVIQGRASLKADAMLARFQEAGGKCEWFKYEDAVCEASFSHPQGGSIRLAWTLERAKAAGLTGKDVWRQYPRAMLRARVISEGIRTVFPGVLSGLYTPEEVGDFDAKPVVVDAVQENAERVAAGQDPIPDEAGKVKARQDYQYLAAFNRAKAAEISKNAGTDWARISREVGDFVAKVGADDVKKFHEVRDELMGKEPSEEKKLNKQLQDEGADIGQMINAYETALKPKE